MIYKVFTKTDKAYAYSKEEAKEMRVMWHNLGITKVMIKGRRL